MNISLHREASFWKINMRIKVSLGFIFQQRAFAERTQHCEAFGSRVYEKQNFLGRITAAAY